MSLKEVYDCFQDIMSRLNDENEPTSKTSLLKELCGLFSSTAFIIKTCACLISPLLIKLAKDESELVADQALECLEALKKISYIHPIAFIDRDGGALMAVLSHIHLFPTDLQRVALAIVETTLRLLLKTIGASNFMRVVPDLVKLLQDDNNRTVTQDATKCLIRIGLSSHEFSKTEIDELSSPNLTRRIIYFLRLGKQVLFDDTYMQGSMKLLTKLCSVSLETFKCLHSSHIRDIFKNILSFQPQLMIPPIE
ncbi:E3 ubiquitin-protein ligase upl4 [Orobanche gracilis]